MVLSDVCFMRQDGGTGHCSSWPTLGAVPGSSFACFRLGIKLLAVLAFSSVILACLYLPFGLGMLRTLR